MCVWWCSLCCSRNKKNWMSWLLEPPGNGSAGCEHVHHLNGDPLKHRLVAPFESRYQHIHPVTIQARPTCTCRFCTRRWLCQQATTLAGKAELDAAAHLQVFLHFFQCRVVNVGPWYTAIVALVRLGYSLSKSLSCASVHSPSTLLCTRRPRPCSSPRVHRPCFSPVTAPPD